MARAHRVPEHAGGPWRRGDAELRLIKTYTRTLSDNAHITHKRQDAPPCDGMAAHGAHSSEARPVQGGEEGLAGSPKLTSPVLLGAILDENNGLHISYISKRA